MNQKPSPHSRWRHYKSHGGAHHTYEVLAIARHSETGEDMVVYRPLYTVTPDSWAYGYDTIVRPLSIWYDSIEWKGEKIARFTQI